MQTRNIVSIFFSLNSKPEILKLPVKLPRAALSEQMQLHIECPKDTVASSLRQSVGAGDMSTKILHFNKNFNITLL